MLEHLSLDPFWLPGVAIALGLVVGSFLNVVIHRLPRGESVVRPRSRCPSCGHTITALENVPVLSYVFLRGRCRGCAAPISARYPALELLTALVFLGLALRAGRNQPQGTPLAIIRAAADAAGATVDQIMVPRAEIVAFPHDTPPAELLERMLNDRYTRVPIYRDSIDTILGKVHLKDLVRLVREGRGDLQSVLRPVLRVPPRKPILSLLTDMQRAFAHLAIVKDEFGVTLGLLTQEDILEELVGEIRDEFDREELLTIHRRDDGTHEVLGRVKVADFNRETGLHIPAEPGDTLSGLVFNAVGHPPGQGESVQVGDYTLTVLDVSGNRITQVGVAHRDAESP